MRVTRRQLRQIIREEKRRLLSEMSVSKKRGWASRNIDVTRPELKELAERIDAAFQSYGVDANIQLFDSGYQGISISFYDPYDLELQKWLVVDQPGVVGPEDQNTGYIFFGPYGPIMKSNAWVWESVPYHKRGYGDVNVRDEARSIVYDEIVSHVVDRVQGLNF